MARGLGRVRKRRRSPERDDPSDDDSTPLFVPVEEVQPRRAPRATSHLGVPPVRVAIATPNNVHLTQIRPSDVRRRPRTRRSAAIPRATAGAASADADAAGADAAMNPRPTSPEILPLPHLPDDGTDPDVHAPEEDPHPYDPVQPPATTGKRRKHRKSRDHLRSQAKRWNREVLPALRQPFFEYLQRYGRAKQTAPSDEGMCTCMKQGRVLRILTVYFNKCETITIRACDCRPAPSQLIELGLFACAPMAPTLAIDIQVLQFCRQAFLRLPPNVTGWCEAIQGFLELKGQEFETRGFLRKRFSAALKWFGALENAANELIQHRIDDARDATRETTPAAPPTPPDRDDHDAQAPPRPQPPQADVASTYLRQCCPICFGKQFPREREPSSAPDVIVCVDGNFTQKRLKKKVDSPDAPRHHPATAFLSREVVERMAKDVETLRAAHATAPSQSDATTDTVEVGMRVPTSVLDSCSQSFIAADEKREKASTKVFSDTGLMALLCRHDRVLWLANLESSGEKQHYALALVAELFKNLPASVTVGLLYDIGCQLHRSCLKWGFLAEFMPRLAFAISVFHAYGHQWVCQIVYHPRKCVGFGLSDGEGCERFWNAIKKLIAPLRVSGYYQRIILLDEQVKYHNAQSLITLGAWLKRRWAKCLATKAEADAALKACDVTLDVLRTEWAAQVIAQTRPLPRRSRNAGRQAVETILSLKDSAAAYAAQVAALEDKLTTFRLDTRIESVEEIDAELRRCRKRHTAIAASIQAKIRSLGVGERKNYERLLSSKFLQLRMNALAIKLRMRERLRERRFERERLEQLYRNIMNDTKLQEHAEDSSTRRDPGIYQLLKSYNDLCSQIAALIKCNQAPKGAVAPVQIPREGLFNLKVDDPIWDDVGLDDELQDDGTTAIPRWLGDDKVRHGIPAMLKVDRCIEEQERLVQERATLEDWAQTEWAAIQAAIVLAGDNTAVCFQLSRRAAQLQKLCRRWERDTVSIPSAGAVLWVPAIIPTERAALGAEVQVTVLPEPTSDAEDEDLPPSSSDSEHEDDADPDSSWDGSSDGGASDPDDALAEGLQELEQFRYMNLYRTVETV